MKKTLFTLGLAIALALSIGAMTAFAAPADVATEAELVAALADPSVDVINITADIEISARLNVTRAMTINGGSNTITVVADLGTDNSKKQAFAILAEGVTVNDLIIDSAGLAAGATVYNGAADFNNVSLLNSKNAALIVNGSTVNVVGLKTSGSAWGAVNVDPGQGVTRPSVFTFDATSSFAEDLGVWTDGKYVTDEVPVTVTPPAGWEMTVVNGVEIWALPEPPVSADPTPTPEPTVTPAPTVTPTPVVTAAPPKTVTVPTSSNPKTGDAAAVFGFASLALASAGVFVSKRRGF